MNKILEIHLWGKYFFQFAILLVIFVVVLNAPILKFLRSASVQYPLETFMFIHLVYNETKMTSLHIYSVILIYMYLV